MAGQGNPDDPGSSPCSKEALNLKISTSLDLLYLGGVIALIGASLFLNIRQKTTNKIVITRQQKEIIPAFHKEINAAMLLN